MSACKYCFAPIAWARKDGGWIPTNADGSQHYCNDKRRIPDVNFGPGKRIVGPRYQPSCGECSIPPWEICPCSALLGVAA